jgi:hypothetical protein
VPIPGALYYAQAKMQLAVDNLTNAINLDPTLLEGIFHFKKGTKI